MKAGLLINFATARGASYRSDIVPATISAEVPAATAPPHRGLLWPSIVAVHIGNLRSYATLKPLAIILSTVFVTARATFATLSPDTFRSPLRAAARYPRQEPSSGSSI